MPLESVPITGITAGEAVSIVGFVGAIIWQSVTLKANLQLVIDRVTKIETDLQKITDVFINQAEIRTNLDGLNARMKAIEERCFFIQTQKVARAEGHHTDDLIKG